MENNDDGCGSDCPRAHLELGQALFGNPAGEYAFPEYAQALLLYVWGEIARTFWNRNQQEFSPYGQDPGIHSIQVRAYYWGEDPEEAARPNFVFGEVEIRWYKYIGRGMSCNVRWTPDQWVAWFDACLKVIQASDKR